MPSLIPNNIKLRSEKKTCHCKNSHLVSLLDPNVLTILINHKPSLKQIPTTPNLLFATSATLVLLRNSSEDQLPSLQNAFSFSLFGPVATGRSDMLSLAWDWKNQLSSDQKLKSSWLGVLGYPQRYNTLYLPYEWTSIIIIHWQLFIIHMLSTWLFAEWSSIPLFFFMSERLSLSVSLSLCANGP